MRSGIQRNHRGRRREEGVKDVDEIPDKEIHRSLGEVQHGGPLARPDDTRSPIRTLEPTHVSP